MKPVIGITVDAKHEPDNERSRGSLTLNWNYAQSVADAGGVPILIAPQSDPTVIAPLLHGLLIPGGADIPAHMWGEVNHAQAKPIDENRLNLEGALYRQLNENVPVLGICYGCQLINVLEGGSLLQHLPDVTETPHEGGPLQEYQIDVQSRLFSIIGAKPQGESWHHQGVQRVGVGLKVVGKHDDGTVEALESTARPWMFGVQWHPERTPNSAATQQLFLEFVSAARKYAQSLR